MEQVVISSPIIKELFPFDKSIKTLIIEGMPVTCGLVETPDVVFDPGTKENSYKVLVRKIAFSCNYRDKGILLKSAKEYNLNTGQKVDLRAVGSDFVARVISVGNKVKQFKTGDRVIGDSHYPSHLKPENAVSNSRDDGYRFGVPTNFASRGMEIFHHRKLFKIPEQMSDETAAIFGIGGITSYSMVRKLKIRHGDNVLVTASKSNTSIFIINALNKLKRRKNIKIYALSRSDSHKEKLKSMGVDVLLTGNQDNPFFLNPEDLENVVSKKLLFDCIIDPFFDLHFAKLVHFMAFGGRYITCGFYDQFSAIVGIEPPCKNQGLEFILGVSKLSKLNAKIIGNCIGHRSDLKQAVLDHIENNFQVPIDSVFTGHQVSEFLERTFNAPDRFGKVIYKFRD